MTDLDYGQFDALTFDCYGTLIDWEAGILAGLRRVVGSAPTQASDDELLERTRDTRPRPRRDPIAGIATSWATACGRWRERTGSRRPTTRRQSSAIRSVIGLRSTTRRPRSPGCMTASGWASSRTAMTTSSPGRRCASGPSSIGS